MADTTNTEPRLARFFYIVGLQLVLAGAWTFAVAFSQGLHTTTLLAIATMVVGILSLLAPFFLKRHIRKFASVLDGLFGRFGAFAIPILISTFLFLRGPGIDALQIIGPILASLWLIGIEILFFFQISQETKPEQTAANRFAIVSILLGYGILLIPSRVPSILDGVPWNTPLEFVAATLALPFGFFLGRRLLSQKGVTFLLALLLVIKTVLGFYLPQSGLGVHIYMSEGARISRIHERTYESFLNPSFSQVMRNPYRTFFDFPVESINHHGFNKESFWIAAQVNGAISLREDERLVILLQGAVGRDIELVDSETGERIPVETAKSSDDLDAEFFDEIPYVGKAELKGVLVFPNYGNGRFEPVILKSDGSVASALPRIWLSPSALNFPIRGFQIVQNLIALILFGVILFSLMNGIRVSFRTGDFDLPDLYLGLTGFILYYVVDVANKPGIDLFFLITVLILSLAKILDHFLRHRVYSGKRYLFAIGIPVLLIFLPLDIHNLSSVVPIPQYQDAMEYQMLARNIYVFGDMFLLQSPPWAYKVLFPYVVGLLHILFGQSLSAQFFINVWCALLSVVFMVKIGTHFGLTKRSAFIAASLFFILLILPLSFTYFFRFGLIEPVAILVLLLTAVFAQKGRYAVMFVLGLITGMLRLNFAGAIFTSITFLAPAFTGGLSQAWGSFVHWLRLSWKRVVVYLVAIPLPSLLIAYGYSLVHPGYTLTHEMNDQTSFASVLESLASVIVGSDREYLAFQIRTHPIDLILITFPILCGLAISLTSLIYRKGVLEKLDLRLSLFLLSMLPVYVILKPIGYFPRYSWSLLLPALIVVALIMQFAFLGDNKNQ